MSKRLQIFYSLVKAVEVIISHLENTRLLSYFAVLLLHNFRLHLQIVFAHPMPKYKVYSFVNLAYDLAKTCLFVCLVIRLRTV